VMHFFDLLNSSLGPAATRWAVLLKGARFHALHFLLRGVHS
jgi:hypothetical protein